VKNHTRGHPLAAIPLASRVYLNKIVASGFTPLEHANQPESPPMNIKSAKKEWIKPAIKEIQIFFECTCYAGSV